MNQHEREVAAGERFEFGANWSRFLRSLNETRIKQAEESLKSMLSLDNLAGKRFLDAGSGSGLFSLAARRLGATVHSFDYDPHSVACTQELKRRFFPDDERWRVDTGSVLDSTYLASLGRFDVVYSWGVLHHTGNMQLALGNVGGIVAPGGQLFVALYNDQGWISSYWSAVKRQYNLHPWMRPLLTLAHAPYLFVGRFIARTLSGRGQLERGMTLWYDMIDWLGGWPFEVSRPEEITGFFSGRGYRVQQLQTVGRRAGCNEFVFSRTSAV